MHQRNFVVTSASSSFGSYCQSQILPVVIGIDNQAAIALAKNPVLHEKTKHIDTRHHFIRQAVQKGYIKLQYIKTNDSIADVLHVTKFTKKSTFEAQTQKLLSRD